MPLQPRIARYSQFINEEYHCGFLKGNEYSSDEFSDDLARRISEGEFSRIVFTGMGCSAIVSDIIRGYLKEQRSSFEVHVVNDYDWDSLLPGSVVHDAGTLFIVSSYSGFSREPLLALQRLLPRKDQVVVLTSGGDLGDLAREHGISILRWRLLNPDREYPLFHVTQYFAILVDFFVKVGILGPESLTEVLGLASAVRADFDATWTARARSLGRESRDANVVMVASPKYHESLLKLCKMHLNEIAMVPATRNFIHEFCHSEVASLSNPERRHSVLVFVSSDDDPYTKEKAANLAALLSAPRPENTNVAVRVVELGQPTFARRFFCALHLVQVLTLELGRYRNTRSRELISEAAGNTWYHQSTISAERLPVSAGS
ncbi:SIS domain-containing protein [Nonomuraea aurantiaca]|uniref:SIS domain-containing protein n=1 Tax=Nonomuraea aurantiaca TaxID=2878562 RepID=UPI001CDA0F95|nr:SIS domain-containing protein [Nonomuraea aurantiaca]MCA2220020.1 hypothetical protein [Nonomuraea aurantiaca]